MVYWVAKGMVVTEETVRAPLTDKNGSLPAYLEPILKLDEVHRTLEAVWHLAQDDRVTKAMVLTTLRNYIRHLEPTT